MAWHLNGKCVFDQGLGCCDAYAVLEMQRQVRIAVQNNDGFLFGSGSACMADPNNCPRYIAYKEKRCPSSCCPYDGRFCWEADVHFASLKKRIESNYITHLSGVRICPRVEVNMKKCSRYLAAQMQQKQK